VEWKHPVAERAVELPERHESRGGVVPEAGERGQRGGHLVEPGDAVRGQRQRGGVGVAELAAGVALVFGRQLAGDGPPHPVLRVRVLAGLPAVVAAHTVAGDADAVVRVRVEGIGALKRTIEQLRRDPRVMRTRTMVALSALVERA